MKICYINSGSTTHTYGKVLQTFRPIDRDWICAMYKTGRKWSKSARKLQCKIYNYCASPRGQQCRHQQKWMTVVEIKMANKRVMTLRVLLSERLANCITAYEIKQA